MSNEFRKAFDGYGRELLGKIRTGASERIDDAVLEERIIDIEKATAAMLEAGIEKGTIISLLQKYWDLRLSEATAFIEKFQSIG